MLVKSHPEAAEKLMEEAQKDVNEKWKQLEYLASEGKDDKSK
jgi:hypothetical protein